MTIKLQEYLRSYGPEQLEEQLAVKYKPHPEYPNLLLFKYDQLNTPRSHPVSNECRGIILDRDDDWKIICRCYDRFFNYGEAAAATIDWSTARVYEKLDGSLMQLYYYDGKWHVASSGTPDAGGPCNFNGNMTFKELFWKTWEELGYEIPYENECCYAFELMTPYNRVVVPHKTSNLVLHGARWINDTDLDQEEVYHPVLKLVGKKYGWKVVQRYALENWDQVMEAAKDLDPMESEGYVVCDINFNRVKVKTEQYVTISHMRDGCSVRNLLKVIRSGENAEFLSYFPEYQESYDKIETQYNRVVKEIEDEYFMVENIEEQKKFAMKVKDSKYSGVLFCLKNGKYSSVKNYLADMNIKTLEEWTDIRNIHL